MTLTRELEKYFSKQPAFMNGDVRRVFPKASQGYLNLLIHNMLKSKRVFRISRGVYSFHDDPQVVGFAFRPFYYGLQDALSFHGLWEQETNPAVITVRRVRSGLRSYENGNYVVRRIGRKMFFGFESVKYGDYWMPVSDVEKTLIDLVYFKQHITADLKKEFRKRVRRDKLAQYLKKCPKYVRRKVNAVLSKLYM